MSKTYINKLCNRTLSMCSQCPPCLCYEARTK